MKELRGATSQTAMAEQLGITRVALIRYEQGKTVPGSDVLEKICRQTGCSADWLLGLPERGGGATVRGNNNAVAIGGSATVRVSAAAGETAACRKCPYKVKVKKLEALLK